MKETTLRSIESARHLVRSVSEGRTSSVYKSTLDYAEALVELDDEMQRLRTQIKLQQLYLKLVGNVLGPMIGFDGVPPSIEEALVKLMDEADKLLSKEQL